MLKAKLVVVGGDAKAAEVRLKLPTVIGRGKEAGLTVPHGLVSRRHTEIIERDGMLYVRDLGSLNGTYVNSTRIEGEQPLEPNQLLTLGNITFRAVYESQSANVVAEEPVAFEEVGGPAKTSISEVVAFDETVPLDSIKKYEGKKSTPVVSNDSNATVNEVLQTVANVAKPNAETLQDHSGANSAKEVVAEKAKKKSSDSNSDSDSKSADSKSEIFCGNETENSQNATSDTDKSFVDTDDSLLGSNSSDSRLSSSKFSLDVDEVDPANKSVLASALEDLPEGQAAVSFVGGIDMGEDAVGAASSQIDAIEIELGEEKKENVDADSTLGSFLKKLPR